MGRISNLREGIPEYKIVTFPDSDEQVALVQLSTKDIIEARKEGMEYINGNLIEKDTADLIFCTFVLVKALRCPENLNEHFADSYDELSSNTTPTQIYKLHELYLEVQSGESFEIEHMSNEEFEDIKKKFETMALSDLDGKLQNILKYFLQVPHSKTSQKDK